MNEIILKAIELAVLIAAFLVGRYLLPKMKINIQNAAIQFEVLFQYAESFCAYARQFLNCPGAEKMNSVVDKLKDVCTKYQIEIDDETLRAIGQKAYDAMVAGEKEASKEVVTEPAVVTETVEEEINTAE